MKDSITIGNKQVTLMVERKLLTKSMYGWSKYGGVNLGLVQEELSPEWSCQGCADKLTNAIDPYMFEFSPREFIRICPMCHFLRLKHHLNTLQSLMSMVRKQHDIWDNPFE